MHQRKAFTLIELLIVVAIIAILAAIAVPNFLEAQTRSKVSRVKADLRSFATAIEAYAVDYNYYPIDVPTNLGAAFSENLARYTLLTLTTPVAYMTSIPWRDPFRGDKPDNESFFDDAVTLAGNRGGSLLYLTFQQIQYDSPSFVYEGSTFGDRIAEFEPGTNAGGFLRRAWLMQSNGPDGNESTMNRWVLYGLNNPDAFQGVDTIYDPTNGTISAGDIGRTSGEPGPSLEGAEGLING